jgi:hypothetical protein
LKIMELVSDAGTGLALPSRVVYMPTRKEAVGESQDRSPRLRYGS